MPTGPHTIFVRKECHAQPADVAVSRRFHASVLHVLHVCVSLLVQVISGHLVGQAQLEQRHAHVQAVASLAEVGSARVRVHVRGDLAVTGKCEHGVQVLYACVCIVCVYVSGKQEGKGPTLRTRMRMYMCRCHRNGVSGMGRRYTNRASPHAVG